MNVLDKDFLLVPEQVDEFLASVRREVVEGSFDVTDGDRIQAMVNCMGDSRGMTRLGFADTLGRVGKPATPFLIEALLGDPDPVVRRASAKTLTLIADPDTVEPLVQALLQDEDTVVRGSSIGALARIGEASVTVLLEILASPDRTESTKGHAAWALAFIGDAGKEHLYKELSSDVESVRSAVVGAIAKIAQESDDIKPRDMLIAALDDTSEDVRSEAAAVLGNLRYQPASPKLVQLLEQHDSAETRKAAALSLMKIGDAGAIPVLEAAAGREENAGISPVLALAVSQLQNKIEDEDWQR